MYKNNNQALYCPYYRSFPRSCCTFPNNVMCDPTIRSSEVASLSHRTGGGITSSTSSSSRPIAAWDNGMLGFQAPARITHQYADQADHATAGSSRRRRSGTRRRLVEFDTLAAGSPLSKSKSATASRATPVFERISLEPYSVPSDNGYLLVGNNNSSSSSGNNNSSSSNNNDGDRMLGNGMDIDRSGSAGSVPGNVHKIGNRTDSPHSASARRRGSHEQALNHNDYNHLAYSEPRRWSSVRVENIPSNWNTFQFLRTQSQPEQRRNDGVEQERPRQTHQRPKDVPILAVSSSLRSPLRSPLGARDEQIEAVTPYRSTPSLEPLNRIVKDHLQATKVHRGRELAAIARNRSVLKLHNAERAIDLLERELRGRQEEEEKVMGAAAAAAGGECTHLLIDRLIGVVWFILLCAVCCVTLCVSIYIYYIL